MSIGLGKKYCVHVVKHCDGNTLEDCLRFLVENKVVACKEYSCDLVEDSSLCKK